MIPKKDMSSYLLKRGKGNSKLEDLAERLSLRNRFPEYFNIWIFRISFLLIVALFIFTVQSNNWIISFEYYGCLPDSPMPCTFGVKPNVHATEFDFRATSLLFFAFLINHLVYALRFKSLKYRRELHEN